ncbi:Kelch-like protein 12 [Vitis vinifera]|uniref:Kelch-like protein 12 n=1 Tax=Vitis vinifera TaxID=29760 RepID=A0A438J2D0_VITVI|nr:Kelch-like protein 12 [Vitis vinifera]
MGNVHLLSSLSPTPNLENPLKIFKVTLRAYPEVPYHRKRVIQIHFHHFIISSFHFQQSIGCRYALGGYDGTNMVPTVEVFDPRIGSWMTGESMNDPRGYSGAVVLGESIYVIGGLKDNEEILDTVECYKEGHGWLVTSLKAVGKRCFFSATVL